MTSMEDLYRLLRAGHVQAQGIVDTVADPLLVLDANLRVQAASRSFFETFKVDRYETIGQPLHELGNGQWDIPELRGLLEDVIPKATAVVNYEVSHDFPELGRRTMLVTARTLNHPDNNSRTMLLTIVDATEERRRDAARDMLFGELRHRMNNLLGVTQSLARNTPTDGRTAQEYRDEFLGRFGALVEAQDLAYDEQEESRLTALIERVLAPYAARPDSVLIDSGASIEVPPRAIMSLSLVLHELATNAAKYGALSVPDGQIRVHWQTEGDSNRLRIIWVESGGPPVSAPTRTGYGTKLIKSAVSYGIGGHVEQRYAAGGLETEIVIPLA